MEVLRQVNYARMPHYVAVKRHFVELLNWNLKPRRNLIQRELSKKQRLKNLNHNQGPMLVDSKTESGSGYIRSEYAGTTKKARVAWAVCEFLHKECDSVCLNFHKLFSDSIIAEVLQSVRTTSEKETVLKTMMIESNTRAKNPRGGCHRKIKELQFFICYYGTQLGRVRRQLEFYRNSLPVVQDKSKDHLVATQLENSLRNTPRKRLAKKPFDTKRAEQKEGAEKSKSQPRTSGKNDSKFESDYPKIGSESEDMRFEDIGASQKPRTTCAVCKHLCKRCPPDCLTAPYFPADKEREFLNVHKLFGHNNMLDLLRTTETTSDKEKAMNCMIFEANRRAKDPAGGCWRVIQNFERKIISEKTELERVLRQLKSYRNSLPVVQDESRDHLVATQMENSLSKSSEESVHESPAKRQKLGL